MVDKDALTRLCLDFKVPDDFDVVIRTPYIPWIPKDWNGVLVLAEAQNMSESVSSDYVRSLKDWTKEKRIQIVERLYNSGTPGEIGIQPWDDGSLKLAIEAAFGVDSAQTAVSNAVLWSQVTGKANRNPSTNLYPVSEELWSQLLNELKPTKVITAGAVARDVIAVARKSVKTDFEHIQLRLPSPNAMSRQSGMFGQEDMLRRFPEVASVVERHPEWIAKYARNKIYFACHAVSLYGGR